MLFPIAIDFPLPDRFLFGGVTAAVINKKVVLDPSARESAEADAVVTFVFESTKKGILG